MAKHCCAVETEHMHFVLQLVTRYAQAESVGRNVYGNGMRVIIHVFKSSLIRYDLPVCYGHVEIELASLLP